MIINSDNTSFVFIYTNIVRIIRIDILSFINISIFMKLKKRAAL